MVKYTPAFQDRVLRQYCAGVRGHSFADLARHHGIKGGASLVHKWYSSWKGNAQSLLRKSGSGRPRVLTCPQVVRYILRPIESRNQKHQPVHYTELKGPVEAAVGHSVSLRTIQRRGKETAGVRSRSTIPRTLQERMPSTCTLQPFYPSPA